MTPPVRDGLQPSPTGDDGEPELQLPKFQEPRSLGGGSAKNGWQPHHDESHIAERE